jgi:hypothetical protein
MKEVKLQIVEQLKRKIPNHKRKDKCSAKLDNSKVYD